MKSEIKEKVETAQSGMTTRKLLRLQLMEWTTEFMNASDEAKKTINNDLNAIFGEEHEEYIR
jgi:hypothetical protein